MNEPEPQGWAASIWREDDPNYAMGIKSADPNEGDERFGRCLNWIRMQIEPGMVGAIRTPRGGCLLVRCNRRRRV